MNWLYVVCVEKGDLWFVACVGLRIIKQYICDMDTYQITGGYIQLIQLLKALNWVEHGGEAQAMVLAGQVRCNGKVDYRKRLKVKPGDTVEFNGKKVHVIE